MQLNDWFVDYNGSIVSLAVHFYVLIGQLWQLFSTNDALVEYIF